jgi:Hypothetical protein (DUF2513)
MKRDLELVRKLMLAIELRADNSYSMTNDLKSELKIDDHSLDEVKCHLAWLIEAKLVDGKVFLGGGGGVSNVSIRKLSWEGCNFLDDARNESVWKKTMATVKEKGGSVSFAILTQLLVSVSKQHFGLG